MTPAEEQIRSQITEEITAPVRDYDKLQSLLAQLRELQANGEAR